MNHFPIPKEKGHIVVPNLTQGQYLQGEGGFHGYPTRMGWTDNDVQGTNNFAHSKEEVQDFFQRWLFFGFVTEVLAVVGVQVDQSRFVDDDKISTAVLPSYIRAWRTNAMQAMRRNDETLIDQVVSIALIFKEVSKFVNTFCISLTQGRKVHGRPLQPLSRRVWLSVQALGQTLTVAWETFYNVKTPHSLWGASKLLRKRMLANGWCPMDVMRCLRSLPIDGHYFIAKIDYSEKLSHLDCNDYECFARNIDEGTYKIVHVGSEGDCAGLILAPAERLREIIDADQVPVYRWDFDTSTLEIAGASFVNGTVDPAKPAYACISHVWSDGMGNPDGNAMLECKLKEIQSMVDAAAQAAGLNTPMYFWMDTLCVPVGQTPDMHDLRKKCIGKMANIYKAASLVLVLSSTFRAVATTDSVYVKGSAFFFTNWIRRLWTYQEGLFARRLFVQFADKALDIDDDTDFPLHAKRSVLQGHCVSFPDFAKKSTMTGFVELRKFLRSGEIEQPYEALPSFIADVTYRSTTKRSDEAICLSVLLGMKLNIQDEVQDEDVDQVDGGEAESDLAYSELAESDLAYSELADSEQANSEEADSEQTNSEEADSKEADSEEADSEEADSEEADSEEADSEEADSEKAESDEAESDEAEQDQADSEQEESEQVDSEQEESEEADSEQEESEEADSDQNTILKRSSLMAKRYKNKQSNSGVADAIFNARTFTRDFAHKRNKSMSKIVHGKPPRAVGWGEKRTHKTDKDYNKGRTRMKAFLKMLRVFPAQIIFNEQERLDRDGLRWAPESFLGYSEPKTLTASRAILSEDDRLGLWVRAPGALFYIPYNVENGQQKFVAIETGDGKKIEVRITPRETAKWEAGNMYAVIMEESPTRKMREMAKQMEDVQPPTTKDDINAWALEFFDRRTSTEVVRGIICRVQGSYTQDWNTQRTIAVRHEGLCDIHLSGEDESSLLPKNKIPLPEKFKQNREPCGDLACPSLPSLSFDHTNLAHENFSVRTDPGSMADVSVPDMSLECEDDDDGDDDGGDWDRDSNADSEYRYEEDERGNRTKDWPSMGRARGVPLWTGAGLKCVQRADDAEWFIR